MAYNPNSLVLVNDIMSVIAGTGSVSTSLKFSTDFQRLLLAGAVDDGTSALQVAGAVTSSVSVAAPELGLDFLANAYTYYQGANFQGADNISASDSNLPMGATARSIAFWANTQAANFGALISYGTNTENEAVEIFYDAAGHIGLTQWGDGIIETTAVPLSTWAFYVFTFDGTTWTEYNNGVVVASGTPTTNTVSDGTMTMGNGYNGYYTGYLQEVQFYNYALSPSTITSLYNSGQGTYGNNTFTGIVAGYHLNGTAADYVGSNDGTWYGSDPTYTLGIVVETITPTPATNYFTYSLLGGLRFNGSPVVPSIDELLPSEGGNAGKFLTTNGTNASWATIPPITPGGSNTDIQFNQSGTFGGNGNFATSSDYSRLLLAGASDDGSTALQINGNLGFQGSGIIVDQNPAPSIDPSNRFLYANDGSTVNVDWSNPGRLLLTGAVDDGVSSISLNGNMTFQTGVIGELPEPSTTTITFNEQVILGQSSPTGSVTILFTGGVNTGFSTTATGYIWPGSPAVLNAVVYVLDNVPPNPPTHINGETYSVNGSGTYLVSEDNDGNYYYPYLASAQPTGWTSGSVEEAAFVNGNHLGEEVSVIFGIVGSVNVVLIGVTNGNSNNPSGTSTELSSVALTSIDPIDRWLVANDGITTNVDWSNPGRVLFTGATDDGASAVQINGDITIINTSTGPDTTYINMANDPTTARTGLSAESGGYLALFANNVNCLDMGGVAVGVHVQFWAEAGIAVNGTTILGGSAITIDSSPNADILWQDDGVGNIGASGTNRPDNIYASGFVVIDGGIANNSSQTTLTGTAGTAVCSQPEQGSSYKKVVIYLNGYTDTGTQTYTFPVPFTFTPYVYGVAGGVSGASASTTNVTFTTTLVSGFVFLEGY